MFYFYTKIKRIINYTYVNFFYLLLIYGFMVSCCFYKCDNKCDNMILEAIGIISAIIGIPSFMAKLDSNWQKTHNKGTMTYWIGDLQVTREQYRKYKGLGFGERDNSNSSKRNKKEKTQLKVNGKEIDVWV